MDKKCWFHKTIRPPTNPVSVLIGKWFENANEGSDYGIFNYGTHLQISELRLENGIYRIVIPRITQPFMSKVYDICKGNPDNNVDTFYALRKNDIIHYRFDKGEALFKAIHVIEIKSFAINPTNIFKLENSLLTSCTHGALAMFDMETSKMTKCDKPANFVLLSFMTPWKTLCRIEGGNVISYYNPYNLEKLCEKPISVEGYKLFSAVQYMDGAIICYVTASESEDEIPPVFYYVSESVDLTEINSLYQLQAPIYAGYPFNAESTAFVTQNMEFYMVSEKLDFNLTKLTPGIRDDGYYTKIIPFNTNILMAVAISGETILLTPPPAKHTMCMMTYFGQMDMECSTPLNQVPYFISYCNTPKSNRIIVYRQGINAYSKGSTLLTDPVTGVYSALFEGKKLIAISHINYTQFVECDSQIFRQTSIQLLRENSQTIGLGTLHMQFTYLIQARPDGVSFIPTDPRAMELIPKNNDTINQVMFFASTYRQVLVCYIKHMIRYYDFIENDGKFMRNTQIFDITLDCTALCFSGQPLTNRNAPQEVALRADTFAVGTSDGKEFAVRFYNANEYNERSFDTAPMMAPVTSIAALTNYRYVIGLDNGCIVVLRHKNGTHPEISNTLSIGQGPVRAVSIERQHVLACNSRVWSITVDAKDKVRYHPVAMHSVSFVAGLGSQHFVGITGTQLELYRVEKLNDLSYVKIPTKQPIVRVKGLDGTPFFFVATESDIKLLDSRGAGHFLDECGDNEEIIDMCVWEPRMSTILKDNKVHTIYVAVIIDKEDGCTIRLYTIPRPSLQLMKPTSVLEGHFNHHYQSITVLPPNDKHQYPLIVVSENTELTLIAANYESYRLDTIFLLQNVGKGIDHLTTNDDIVIVGDVSSSVTFLKYSAGSRSLKVVGKDNSVRPVTALKPALPRACCGGDRFGNVFYFDLQNVAQKQNLALTMNYNVGDIVTGVDFTSDIYNCIWYQTVNGQIGALIQLNDEYKSTDWQNTINDKITILKMIEKKTEWQFASLTNCFAFEFHNKQFPAGVVLDLDIIDIFVNSFAPPRQQAILDNFKKSTNRNLSLEYVASTLNQFKNYFWNWKDKK